MTTKVVLILNQKAKKKKKNLKIQACPKQRNVENAERRRKRRGALA